MGGLIDEVPIPSEVAKVMKNTYFLIIGSKELVNLVENSRARSSQGSARQPQAACAWPRWPLGGVEFQGKV